MMRDLIEMRRGVLAYREAHARREPTNDLAARARSDHADFLAGWREAREQDELELAFFGGIAFVPLPGI